MFWLTVAIFSYILLAAASLIDKFLLSGPLSNPKIYAFYIGVLSSVALLLLPFGIWTGPRMEIILVGIIAGFSQIYGSYFYLSTLKHLEVSRAVPIIGSLVPIIGFFLTALISGGAAVLSPHELAGFFLLIAGSWLIMAKGFKIQKNGLQFVFPASFLFALTVVLSKLVYLYLPQPEKLSNVVFFGINFSSFVLFLSGFVLLAFGSMLAAATFLFSENVRKILFHHHHLEIEKHSRPNFLFFAGQGIGGIAFILQSFAVSLAPQASVPVVNALAGIQYVFLFIFSAALSLFFPSVLKEKNTFGVIIQKTIAIFMIISGLLIFTLG
jgi:hypothetical protein